MSLLAILPLGGCATYWQVSSLEEKVELLLQNTKREALTQIFGEQSQEITRRMDALDSGQKESVDRILTSYQAGQASIEEVRAAVVNTLGGTTRVVSSDRGVWVRDPEGRKLMTLSRDAKIQNCERLADYRSSKRGAGLLRHDRLSSQRARC